MNRVLVICVVSLLWGASGGARADDSPGTFSDDQFVAKAAKSGSTEVELGKLAMNRSERTEVKNFGERLMNDHTKANNELLSLAGKKAIAVPKKVDAKQQECIDDLGKLRGSEFDREFASHMVKSHKEAIELFEKESETGKDADLKAFATRTLPTLKEHLRRAQELSGEKKAADVK